MIKAIPETSIFSFICMLCRSLFVLLYFFPPIVLSILLRYTDSDCIFKLFFKCNLLHRELLLTQKLLNLGFLAVKLKTSLPTFRGHDVTGRRPSRYVVVNFVIHNCLSKATKLQWPRGKKIPPAVTLGMVIVNKGNNKITELQYPTGYPRFVLRSARG
jgi:hypothetical protein